MIFAVQESGKYAGHSEWLSLTYVASNGKPGDHVIFFNHHLNDFMTFESFMERMDKICFRGGGSELIHLMEWYMMNHNGEDMTILSNGMFPGMGMIEHFDEWLMDNMMTPEGKISWFDPLISG